LPHLVQHVGGEQNLFRNGEFIHVRSLHEIPPSSRFAESCVEPPFVRSPKLRIMPRGPRCRQTVSGKLREGTRKSRRGRRNEPRKPCIFSSDRGVEAERRNHESTKGRKHENGTDTPGRAGSGSFFPFVFSYFRVFVMRLFRIRSKTTA
jgi:hypothetical protein